MYHHDDSSCERGEGKGPRGHGHGGGFGGFGHRGFRGPFGHGGHGGFGPGGRARRGDVRTAVLRLLAEQPMHGYQIIQELSSRSGGAWSPSAGSVYPTLQLLADEGLVTAEESGGKKVFSLTEAGTAAVAEMADQPAPWEEAAEGDTSTDLREAAGRLMPAIMQIGKNGSADQRTRAAAVLSDARKELYKILAED
ncbi:MAG: PadR family transcriptional regulator [Coriobacteriia bacterium]|nr:PadR family transcriptional regulator [Coriobacteriia bacterium]